MRRHLREILTALTILSLSLIHILSGARCAGSGQHVACDFCRCWCDDSGGAECDSCAVCEEPVSVKNKERPSEGTVFFVGLFGLKPGADTGFQLGISPSADGDAGRCPTNLQAFRERLERKLHFACGQDYSASCGRSSGRLLAMVSPVSPSSAFKASSTLCASLSL